MRLTLKRVQHRDRCTIGTLVVDGKAAEQLYTLEDKDREQFGSPVELWKIPGETAIPRGVYKIELRHSLHFNRTMPFLVGVPGFEGVMIHWGNTDRDVEGCIAVGEHWDGADHILESKAAFAQIWPKLLAAAKRKEKIEIQIS